MMRGEEWDFSCNLLMVSLCCENLPDARYWDFCCNLVCEFGKGHMSVLPGSANDLTFVIVSQLAWLARTWFVCSWTSFFEVVDEILCSLCRHISIVTSSSGIPSGKVVPNDVILCWHVKLMSRSLSSRHLWEEIQCCNCIKLEQSMHLIWLHYISAITFDCYEYTWSCIITAQRETKNNL
jgi:hypothetical protein